MAVRVAPRVLLLIALVISASVAVSSRAEACSCVPPRLERVELPRDGAMDVPTDATMRVFLTSFSPSLRAQLGAEYQLRDAHGALVPLDTTVVSTRLDLRPRAPLRASETYMLERLFVFAADGTRLSDDERARAAPGSLRGAFFPVARFTTTAAASAPRAIAPHVDDASLSFPRGGGDCGPGAGIAVQLAPTAGAGTLDVIELRVREPRGQSAVVSTRPASETMLYAGDLLCAFDPLTLPAGQSVAYQIAWLDGAGRELGVTAWARVSGRGSRRRAQRVVDRGVPRGWAATPITTPSTAATPRGPTGCEHGLEERARVELVATGAPSAYADRPALLLDATRVWSFYPSAPEGTGTTLRALSTAFDASPLLATTRETTIEGWPDAVVPLGSSGAIVLARRYQIGAVTTATLTSLELSTDATRGPLAIAWQTPFDASAGRYRMAISDRELAIVYGRRPPGEYSESLSFVFVDPRDGHETGPALHTAHGLDANAEGAAIAHVGGRFVVVWPSGVGLAGRGPLRATTVSSAGLGTIVDLPIASYSPPDLVSVGTVAGLATATSDGRVELSVIGPDGALVRGPFALSRGVGGRDNRMPRIAWDGHRFAVLWETHPATGAYVVVVDVDGHVSPPLRLDRSEVNASGLGIVATPSGFVATYSAGYGEHGMAIALRCRAQLAAGPPIAIAPSS